MQVHRLTNGKFPGTEPSPGYHTLVYTMLLVQQLIAKLELRDLEI